MQCTFLILLLSITQLCQAQLAARLDSLFARQPDSLPGFALSISKNGEIIYRNAKGFAGQEQVVPHQQPGKLKDQQPGSSQARQLNEYSNFRMASVTKQFTAMAILLLESANKLSLDDPIGRYLPEMPSRLRNGILIRHLLTHASGLLDYESLIPEGRTAQLLDADVLELLRSHDSTYFPPGSRFRYSNSGFCLLALIIERVSGNSYPAFLKEKIFTPLGMDSSTVYEAGKHIPNRAMGYAKDSAGFIRLSDQSITSATKGDGGVYTSLADYEKWVRALQQNRLLKLSAVLKRLRQPIAGMPDSYYGAGWFQMISPPVILFHSGSTCGFSNFVVQIPGDSWSLTLFSNLADNSIPFRTIVKILKEEQVAGLDQVFALHDLTN